MEEKIVVVDYYSQFNRILHSEEIDVREDSSLWIKNDGVPRVIWKPSTNEHHELNKKTMTIFGRDSDADDDKPYIAYIKVKNSEGKQVSITYYDKYDNKLHSLETTAIKGSFVYSHIGDKVNAYSTPGEFNEEAHYAIIEEIKKAMKEVLITYYDDNGYKISTERTGTIEGSPMYERIGTMFSPAELGTPYLSEAAYATMEECSTTSQEECTMGIIKTLKSLSAKEKKTLIQRALKMTEETGEVAEAVLSYTDSPGCGYKQKTREDVMEECVDVIIMATSIIANLEFKDEDVASTFVKKMTKWEANMK